MIVFLLLPLFLASEPVLYPQAPNQPVRARASSASKPEDPAQPTSATGIFEKKARIKNQIAENEDEILRIRKQIEKYRNVQKEHEKVLKGERPFPNPDDPLIGGTRARTTAYNPKTAIDALTIQIFLSNKSIERLRYANDRFGKDLVELDAALDKLAAGPYLVLGTIPLGASVQSIENARKVAVEPADFHATFGRVVHDDDKLGELDEAVLRAIFPILVDVYEIDDFRRPDLIREFGKIRLLVERRTGIVFAVSAEWSESGTQAAISAPDMAKRTRELLTVLQAKYPDLNEQAGSLRDSLGQFLIVSVSNERTDEKGHRVQLTADELRNMKPGEAPPKNSVFLTFALKAPEKRVIDAVRRIETRRAFGSLEEIRKKGDGL